MPAAPVPPKIVSYAERPRSDTRVPAARGRMLPLFLSSTMPSASTFRATSSAAARASSALS